MERTGEQAARDEAWSSGVGEPVEMNRDPKGPRRRFLLLGVLAATSLSSACTPTSAETRPLPTPSSTPGSPMGATAPVVTQTSTSPPSTPTQPPHLLSIPGPDITTGPTTVSAVALTFHGAGDPGLTGRVLSIAAAARAALTVFAVGQWLAANPTLGRDIVAAGHDLGNHTWSHQAMLGLDLAAAVREVQLGADAVARSVGAAGLLFRPSGTPTSTPTIRSAARAAGYPRCVSYDVDPLDYTDPGADLVRTRTFAAIRAGSIVSLHLGHPGTVDALPGILKGLADQGLAAVSVSQLLAGPS